MRIWPVVALLTVSGSALAKPAKPAARVTHSKRRHGNSRFESPANADALPAVRYGAMTPAACTAELDARKVPYRAETAAGVLAPVRLTGPLHGVTFRTDIAEKDRATTPWEIADCRLVLALDDFAQLLAKHDVVEVVHYSMHRQAPKTWPDGKIGIQHIGGLAIDAARFIKSDGTKLVVLDDFHGKIGDATCGSGAAPHPATAKATELRQILCDAVAQHLFSVVLTPDFNRPHRNHFHLEVMANKKWFLVH